MKRSDMTLAQKLEADRKPKPLKKYTFHIRTNPPIYEIALGISKIEEKDIEVYGTSRKDAMRRAGIQ